jgi:hypothetical protein
MEVVVVSRGAEREMALARAMWMARRPVRAAESGDRQDNWAAPCRAAFAQQHTGVFAATSTRTPTSSMRITS